MKTKMVVKLFVVIFLFFCYPAKSIAQKDFSNHTDVTRPVFTDITSDVGLQDIPGGRFSWNDFNNDGYPDLLIRGCGLYKNTGPLGNWKFIDVTEKVGLDKGSSFGVWGDYNNDGFADILSCNGVLWMNNEGKAFKNVTEETKLKITQKIATVSWGDYDNDGFIDIYVGPVADEPPPSYVFYSHELWKNYKGKHFEKVSINNEIGQAKTYVRSAVWCDYNNDGRQEIYVGNYLYHANFLWKFDKNNNVKNIAEIVGCAGKAKKSHCYGHTIGATWADFNNDALFDLLVANLAHKDNFYNKEQLLNMRADKNDDSYIYINQGLPGHKFVDIRHKSDIPRKPVVTVKDVKLRGITKIEDELWYDVVCADFDNDSYIDVFITQAYNRDYARTLLFHNLGNLKFKDVSTETKINLITDSGGVAVADFNCDGFVDIVTSGSKSINEPKNVHLYRNEGNDKSWIKFQLTGSASNRSAIGAIVKIKTKNGIQVRQVEGSGSSHGQQNSMVLHFGLGDMQKVNEVEILWPSGKKQKLTDLSVKKIHKITELQ